MESVLSTVGILLIFVYSKHLEAGTTFSGSVSTFSTAANCPDRDDGLTNTSIVVHYRLFINGFHRGGWVFISVVNTSDASHNQTHYLSQNIELPSDSTADGMQLRLLQLEHGGEGCHCWEVEALNLSGYMINEGYSMGDPSCFSRGRDDPEQQIFCSGVARRARGLVTEVFYFTNHSGERCTQRRNLIPNRGPALPENCSTITPRM
jgi:hypothetical protein